MGEAFNFYPCEGRMAKTYKQLMEEARQEIPEVTVDEVKNRVERGENWTLLDVREREEYREGILCSSGQSEALHQGRLGHFNADLTMRQPFCRWRHGDQTWRVRIMCQRCGSLSGPAIGPASST